MIKALLSKLMTNLLPREEEKSQIVVSLENLEVIKEVDYRMFYKSADTMKLVFRNIEEYIRCLSMANYSIAVHLKIVSVDPGRDIAEKEVKISQFFLTDRGNYINDDVYHRFLFESQKLLEYVHNVAEISPGDDVDEHNLRKVFLMAESVMNLIDYVFTVSRN